jgi:hypothetical protein
MKTIVAALISIALASPAFAGDPPAAGTAKKPEQKKERKICRDVQETGSRMGNLKMCMSAAAWREHDAQADRFDNGDLYLKERVMSSPTLPSGGPN